MTTLDELRARLDDIDTRLIELIAERQRTSSEIARVKRATGYPTRDYGREREVIVGARARAEAHGVSPRIAEELMAGGLAADTPAAVIQQGTVRGQRQLISVLAELADRAEEQGFASPSIVVLGEVVAQRVPACAPDPADAEMPIPF